MGKRLLYSCSVHVKASQAAAFRPIRRLGGAVGWYYADWLWSLRGWMDRLAGGRGLQRTRRDPERLEPGDTLDCWRVEHVEADGRLGLVSDLKLPGRGWLEFEVVRTADGSRITQTAAFEPDGVVGLLYWYVTWPIHSLMFRGMLRKMALAVQSAPMAGQPGASLRYCEQVSGASDAELTPIGRSSLNPETEEAGGSG